MQMGVVVGVVSGVIQVRIADLGKVLGGGQESARDVLRNEEGGTLGGHFDKSRRWKELE